jgi:hypothetical protein
MNADKARAIINQAKIEEIYEGPIPEEDEKAVEEADKLIALAQDAWNQHVRGPEVESILRIANDEFDGSTESEPEEEVVQEVEAEVEDVQEVVLEEPVEEQSDSQLPWDGYDDQKVSDVIANLEQYASAFEGDDLREFLKTVWEYESAGKSRTTVFNSLNKLAEEIDNEAAEEDAQDELEAPEEQDDVEEAVESTPAPEREEAIDYKAVIDAVDAELAADTRHVPSPPAAEAPELPWDWTKSSDTEIQSLYSYYSLLAYYKSFTLIREDRIALECKRAADELANELLKVSDKYDEKGKEKKVTLLEAEVEADPHVSKWRRLQRKHEAFCASARRERDSLYKLVESLSRFETMRQQEWQRSGQSYK